MCEICLSTPCRPQCPNAPEPTPVLRCCKCKEEIFEGNPILIRQVDNYVKRV